MKKLFAFLLLFTVVTMLTFQACDKSGSNEFLLPSINTADLPPVAVAGMDTTIVITICESKGTAQLDGHLSYDPSNNSKLKFLWKQVNGPIRVFAGVDTTRDVITLNNLVVGGYTFVLEVFDTEGRSSRDSLLVNIYENNEYKAQELNAVGTYVFRTDNQYYGYGYDEFVIQGNVRIGNSLFNFNFYESSDPGTINTAFTNFFNLYDASNSGRILGGSCSLDFESLYLKGGGDFEGTIKVISGSAFSGCENLLLNYPPIHITGNLSGGSNTITIKLKGDFAF